MAGEPQDDCLFCKIVAGQIPATIVRETETTVAFQDINPQAPTHVLVIPRVHYRDVATLASAEPAVAADLLRETGEDEDLRLSRLKAENDRLRARLIEAHVAAEEAGDAERLAAIWAELVASTERRKLSVSLV